MSWWYLERKMYKTYLTSPIVFYALAHALYCMMALSIHGKCNHLCWSLVNCCKIHTIYLQIHHCLNFVICREMPQCHSLHPYVWSITTCHFRLVCCFHLPHPHTISSLNHSTIPSRTQVGENRMIDIMRIICHELP